MKDESLNESGFAALKNSIPSIPRDFDFLVGSWIVHHKRLRARMDTDGIWEHFRGFSCVSPILGGYGTLEETLVEPPEGVYHAVTLRCFDPQSNAWSISEIDGRRPSDRNPPLTGRFRDGLGAFFSEQKLGERSIRARFIWSNITPTSARGQQAFSSDDGASWATYWTMEFERTAAGACIERRVGRQAQQ